MNEIMKKKKKNNVIADSWPYFVSLAKIGYKAAMQIGYLLFINIIY